jgi:hypothetical protein
MSTVLEAPNVLEMVSDGWFRFGRIVTRKQLQTVYWLFIPEQCQLFIAPILKGYFEIWYRPII